MCSLMLNIRNVTFFVYKVAIFIKLPFYKLLMYSFFSKALTVNFSMPVVYSFGMYGSMHGW